MGIKRNNIADSYKAFLTASDLLREIENPDLCTPINKIIYEYDIRLFPFSEAREIIPFNSPIFKTVGELSHLEDHYCILYDDSCVIQRVRWTLAHELGHYFLNHPFENTNEYDKLEAEANYFASQLLMPLELLLILEYYYNLCEPLLSFVCNVNHKASRYRMNYFRNHKATFKNFDLNQEMMEKFDHLIKRDLLYNEEFESLKKKHYLHFK